MNAAALAIHAVFLVAASGDTTLVAGRDVPLPKQTAGSRPVYPEIAAQARVEAMVILRLTVNPEGRITDIRIVQGMPLIDQAAIDAAKTWRFEPTIVDGTPRSVELVEAIPFFLDERGVAKGFTRLATEKKHPAHLRTRAIAMLTGFASRHRKAVVETLQKLSKDEDEVVAKAAADALAGLPTQGK